MKDCTTLCVSAIYFKDESKNIYAKMPLDKEQAKRLSKRIFKDAMAALSVERTKQNYLAATLFPNS